MATPEFHLGQRGSIKTRVLQENWGFPAGPLLERAIGVIYRPRTERQSHYFYCELPRQFDLVIHLDRTSGGWMGKGGPASPCVAARMQPAAWKVLAGSDGR
jgi:hypothetical protein